MAGKFKIKKGDQVVVITGRDKGKKGEVLEVLRAESRVRVQGANMVKRHRRATQNDAGGIISIEAPFLSRLFEAVIVASCKSTKFLTIFNPKPECFPNLSGLLL